MCNEENPLERAFREYYRGNYHGDLTPTATPEEQAALKDAFAKGAIIEAKGKDHLCAEYTWAAVANPRFDFNNNHYRVKADSEPSPTQK